MHVAIRTGKCGSTYIAFYLGQQWVSWARLRDGSGKLLAPPSQTDLPVEQREPRPVINRIMHFTNQSLAFAMQSKPVADVLPANDDYLAQGDAAVANAYINYLQEPNVGNWEAVMWDANMWALIANEAYIKWVYDPKEDRPTFLFCPSTDIYSDPYCRDFYKARWVIHSQFLDPEQVYDVYNVEVPPSKIESADLQRTQLLQEMGQVPIMSGCTVNELWLKPSRRYPKGLFRVWSGRTVLVESQDFPYAHGELPFTVMGGIPRPNSKHYASPVTFLRAPQAELNRYHAQRFLTRQNWALLKLWLPEEIELEKPWDNSPHQILKGSSSTGAEPRIIGPPGAMPDNADGEYIRQAMQDTVGLHEVSQGQVPGRVEAAKAIELLRESDTSRLAVLLATTGTAISRGWYQALMLARQYRQEEIVVESYSMEGVPEVKRFFAEQFKPGMRIRVTVGSGLAFSRAARLDQLTNLWTQGILRDPEAFAQLADIPIPSVISTKAFDVKLARNENLILAAGKAVQANSWDDHTIHIREHNSYRKTAEFAALGEEATQRFEFHVQQHKALELKQLQEDAQKTALVQQAIGPPPSQGGGAGPQFQDAEVGPGSFAEQYRGLRQSPDPLATQATGA